MSAYGNSLSFPFLTDILFVFEYLLRRLRVFFIIIYLQHAPLNPVVLHALLYTYNIYIFADLFTVYALIVRLQFFAVSGVCKIGKLF